MLRSHKMPCSRKSLGWQRSGFLRSEVSAVDVSTLFREMQLCALVLQLGFTTPAETTPKDPGLLLSSLATAGITRNSKCWACSSYKCDEMGWHLGSFQLFLNQEADKRTHHLLSVTVLCKLPEGCSSLSAGGAAF